MKNKGGLISSISEHLKRRDCPLTSPFLQTKKLTTPGLMTNTDSKGTRCVVVTRMESVFLEPPLHYLLGQRVIFFPY